MVRIDEVHYFGYGANRDPKMMEAIIGRVPEGYPATVSGFELCVQGWEQIPSDVRQGLSPPWDETFRTYVLRPTSGFTSHPVRGMMWKITRQERRLIDNWEMTGKWYKVFLLQYELAPQKFMQTWKNRR